MKKFLSITAIVVTVLVVVGILAFPGVIGLFEATIGFMLIAPPSLIAEVAGRNYRPSHKPDHD